MSFARYIARVLLCLSQSYAIVLHLQAATGQLLGSDMSSAEAPSQLVDPEMLTQSVSDATLKYVGLQWQIYATAANNESLPLLLKHVTLLKTIHPALPVHVWLWPDVSDEDQMYLCTKLLLNVHPLAKGDGMLNSNLPAWTSRLWPLIVIREALQLATFVLFNHVRNLPRRSLAPLWAHMELFGALVTSTPVDDASDARKKIELGLIGVCSGGLLALALARAAQGSQHVVSPTVDRLPLTHFIRLEELTGERLIAAQLHNFQASELLKGRFQALDEADTLMPWYDALRLGNTVMWPISTYWQPQPDSECIRLDYVSSKAYAAYNCDFGDVSSPSIRRIVVAFSSFWPSFDYKYNMFVLMLDRIGRAQTPFFYVYACHVDNCLQQGLDIDFMFVGQFDSHYRLPQYDGIPKVAVEFELWRPIAHRDIVLSLGVLHSTSKSFLRFAYWLFHVDWFQADMRRHSVHLIPLEQLTRAHPQPASQRSGFCTFIVSNPSCRFRNEAFEQLNQYKRVDSAGQYRNNMPHLSDMRTDRTPAIDFASKLRWQTGYRFCIAMENAAVPGYVTEKLLDAKASGCVPIYWGDPHVHTDFDRHGFINANGMNHSQIVETVKNIERNASTLDSMASRPALDPLRSDRARLMIANVAKALRLIVEKRWRDR